MALAGPHWVRHDKLSRRQATHESCWAAQKAERGEPRARILRSLVSATERTGSCEEETIQRLVDIGKFLQMEGEAVQRVLRPIEMARSRSRQEAASILGVALNAIQGTVEAA